MPYPQFMIMNPARGGFAITPSDSVDLARETRAIMVTVEGNVAVVTVDGSSFTLPALEPGSVYPVSIVRVLATGTTASGIVALT